MTVIIEPGRADGSVSAPPSKSFSHRMLIAAALADGESRIHNIALSEDVMATLDCISALGAATEIFGNTIVVCGAEKVRRDTLELQCRESGSTLRFLLPVSLLFGATAIFSGTERLVERGVGVYETLFNSKGVTLEKRDTGISVRGTLSSGDYCLPGNVSSQYISGLMFALPLLHGDSRIEVIPPVESRAYIDITMEVLRQFSIVITEETPNCFYVPGDQSYKPVDISVEGDWSNAAFLLALNSLGGNVSVSGLNAISIQGDKVFAEHVKSLDIPGTLIDLSGCPDLGPILFALAAAKSGAVFTGTSRLRLKESDRAAAMAEELRKFGAEMVLFENQAVIHNSGLKKPSKTLFGHNDHRIVMSLAVLCSVIGGEIEGAEAVRKSFPDFFDILEELGVNISYEVE